MTPEELEANLNQFCGTENWYKHPFGCFTYTDGVKYLATEAKAYWLIDAIASHQKKARKSSAGDFQIWELVTADHKATLTCRDDDSHEVIQQEIEYTDFPLPYMKLWLTDSVLLLPSEY